MYGNAQVAEIIPQRDQESWLGRLSMVDVDSSRRNDARNEVGAVHERITKFVVHDDWHRIDDIWFCSSDNVFFGEGVQMPVEVESGLEGLKHAG